MRLNSVALPRWRAYRIHPKTELEVQEWSKLGLGLGSGLGLGVQEWTHSKDLGLEFAHAPKSP